MSPRGRGELRGRLLAVRQEIGQAEPYRGVDHLREPETEDHLDQLARDRFLLRELVVVAHRRHTINAGTGQRRMRLGSQGWV